MYKLKHIIWLVVFLFINATIYAQSHSIFKHLTPTIDNESVSIYKTAQDHIGNIWMTCNAGVLIYDGYDYKLIKNTAIFLNGESNDRIKDILSDDAENIWITSELGLVIKYNRDSGKFMDLSSLFFDNDVIAKIIAKEDKVWFASKNGHVYKYQNNKIFNVLSPYRAALPFKDIFDFEVSEDSLYMSSYDGKVFSYSLSSNQCHEIVGVFSNYGAELLLKLDNYNRLWIGTETFGLLVYDIPTKTFVQDDFFKGSKFNISNELFFSLFLTSSDCIYAGTDGGGLYKIDTKTGIIDLYNSQLFSEFSINSNTIWYLDEDKHKNLWISTKKGLNVLPNSDGNIKYHMGSANNMPERILSLHKSSNDDLWVGTDGSGLTKISFNNDNTIKETQYFVNRGSGKGYYIQSIAEDVKSNIWFGTYKNGLWKYDLRTNRFGKIQVYNSKNQKATDVRTIFVDKKERIWVGSNVSINIYDDNEKLLTTFDYQSNGLKGYIVESLIEDNNGVIWLGVKNGGLFKFNEDTLNIAASTFENYSNKAKSSNNKSNSDIIRCRALSQGRPNELFMITHDLELLKFNVKDNSFTSYDHIEAFKEQSFVSIIQQDEYNYWLGSKSGIHHLNIKDSVTIETFYTTDGLQDNTFSQRSVFKDDQGIIYFGGVKGFNYFDPKYLKKTLANPKLSINAIEVLNQSSDSLVSPQISRSSGDVETLDLSYNQSSFSFRFSAIDNVLNSKYYYAYRLKGFNDEWVVGQSERLANYTDIPSGDYMFEVKAGTKKGIWNISPKRVKIKIDQPFWKTPMAYVLYLILIIVMANFTRRFYMLSKKLFLEKVNSAKEKEIDKSKMNFFAKMSHEIQTPITLILGPMENMIQQAEQNGNLLLKQRLNIISNNAKRLSRIARELTLVRNKEMGKLRLLVTENNLFNCIEQITLSFKEIAREKEIDFAVNCPENLPKVWYDKEKIEHILYNLLSNAFKFTPRQGNIQLHVMPFDSKRMIKISVQDSGPGISESELKHIFELFYQSKEGRGVNGSGIGLALTKDLVDLHKGKIEVVSKVSQGVNFTITFSVHENAYSDSERIITTALEKQSDSDVDDITNENNVLIDQEEESLKKTVLIVEDNYDLQIFLKNLLMPDYNILLAENGEEGYLYAKKNSPDLIISDVMMPKIDGIEMCEKLQENKSTKHIPIVLLTAKNSTKSKIHGLRSGAIEYINKPFNTNELLLKVNNILTSKEHIISKYRKELIARPDLKNQKLPDETFLVNMMDHINLRLGDSNFKMEELADSLNISYSSLYRKCLSLTGHTIADYVRLLRLKKAAILITKYDYNISEAAYMCGFSNPRYFSKCFKKHFNIIPKDFKSEAKISDVDKYLGLYNIQGNVSGLKS